MSESRWKMPRRVGRIIPSVGARMLDELIEELDSEHPGHVLLERLRLIRSKIGVHRFGGLRRCANPYCQRDWQEWDRSCFYCDSDVTADD